MKNPASISALIVAFSAAGALAILSTACGDDDTNGGGSSTSSSSSSSSSGGADGGASSSSSSSSSSGGTGKAALAKASCADAKKCQAAFYTASYPTDADCENAAAPAGPTYPGKAELSDTEAAACAAATTAAGYCGAYVKECTKAGTGEDGAKCDSSDQCKNGLCVKAGASDKCGTCGKAKAAEETCDALKGECGPGLYCKSNVCKPFIAKDAACAAGEQCTPGTACNAGTCKVGGEVGANCTVATASVDCRQGLSCDGTNHCADLSYVGADKACGTVDGKTVLCAKNLTCFGTAGNTKCGTPAAEGADCAALPNGEKPTCGAGLSCNASNKCEKVAACQ